MVLDLEYELWRDLQCGEVGGELDLVGPARELCADLVQHPATDRQDQPGVFGDLDELVGRDQPAVGVAPAQQRLETHQSLVGKVDDWLVVQFELLARDCVAEVALDRHSLHEVLAELRVEELKAAAAEVLGAVHRGVCVAQQLFRALAAVFADGDPDTGGHEHFARRRSGTA